VPTRSLLRVFVLCLGFLKGLGGKALTVCVSLCFVVRTGEGYYTEELGGRRGRALLILMARQPVAVRAAASGWRSLRSPPQVGLRGTLRQGVLSLRAQEDIFVGDIVEYPLPEVTMHACCLAHTIHLCWTSVSKTAVYNKDIDSNKDILT
jgi:hypothetical protein